MRGHMGPSSQNLDKARFRGVNCRVTEIVMVLTTLESGTCPGGLHLVRPRKLWDTEAREVVT
jgi:hypothetical protein